MWIPSLHFDSWKGYDSMLAILVRTVVLKLFKRTKGSVAIIVFVLSCPDLNLLCRIEIIQQHKQGILR